MSLPFKISAQPTSVQKAHQRFVNTYGKKEGERIFLEYAELHGRGTTPRLKARTAFQKGGHIG